MRAWEQLDERGVLPGVEHAVLDAGGHDLVELRMRHPVGAGLQALLCGADPRVIGGDALLEQRPGPRRMTMTLPLLSRARWILWLVTGGEKAGVVRQLVAGDPVIAAGRIRAEHAALVADLDAAALLGSSPHR